MRPTVWILEKSTFHYISSSTFVYIYLFTAYPTKALKHEESDWIGENRAWPCCQKPYDLESLPHPHGNMRLFCRNRVHLDPHRPRREALPATGGASFCILITKIPTPLSNCELEQVTLYAFVYLSITGSAVCFIR